MLGSRLGTFTFRMAGEYSMAESKADTGENGIGLTSKATDWSPEIGIMFSLPTRGL